MLLSKVFAWAALISTLLTVILYFQQSSQDNARRVPLIPAIPSLIFACIHAMLSSRPGPGPGYGPRWSLGFLVSDPGSLCLFLLLFLFCCGLVWKQETPKIRFLRYALVLLLLIALFFHVATTPR